MQTYNLNYTKSMKEIQFSIEIHAFKEKVWDTLWQDETFRDWASVIDPETYMIGVLSEGSEVQFISANGGYGVTSLVEALIVNEFLLLRHQADTQNEGSQEREKEWSGGKESYRLVEKNSITTLTVTFDIPPSQEDYFTHTYPKALERVKQLAEK